MEKENKVIEATAMATGTATATKTLERSGEDEPILRDVSEVINELSSVKAAEQGQAEAQKTVEMIKAGHVQPTSLKRVSQNGSINFGGLSENEKHEIIEIGKRLDVRVKMSIKNFGSELSDNLNKSTKTLLSKSSQSKIGTELEGIMKEVSVKLGEIDLDDIKAPSTFMKFLRKLPVVGKFLYDGRPVS